MALGLALVSAACAPLRDETAVPPAAAERPVWPPPPSRPRIELHSTFARASDLGIDPSLWRRFTDLITGGGEIALVRPAGVAVAGARIAVADPGAGVVHLFDLSARISRVVRGCADRGFAEPVAVAFLGETLYVSDAATARILIVRPDGDCDPAWTLPAGSRPAGLAADPQRQRLYVADAGAHRILAYDPSGQLVLRFGRRGSGRGELNYPTWLAVDPTGALYVTDALNFRVQRFDPSGEPLGGFGQHGDSSGDVAAPKGIAIGGDGEVYLVDALFDAVQMFDGDGNYLMVFGGRGREPGRFWLPAGIAVAGDRIYVADSYNRRVQIFRSLGGEP